MTTQEVIDLEQKYILQTYGRPTFVFEKGDGVHLYDTDGNKYLDFVSGLSVNALGYGNKMISDAAASQTDDGHIRSATHLSAPRRHPYRRLIARPLQQCSRSWRKC